jgi:two-component system chemotaxis sensor kinase CheA
LLLSDHTRPISDAVNEIFREVHTLKGNFAVFEIPWTVDFLDSVERSLFVIREDLSCMTIEKILFILKGYDFKGALDDLLDRLSNMIGSRWTFDRDFAVVGVEEIKALEDEAGELSIHLAQKLKKLRYIKLSQLLSTYPQYTFRLAERLGKSILPFTIKCDEDIFVDAEKYYEFSRSLVNVFRNCADHGIEAPEERAAAGKLIEGEICCTIEKGQEEYKVIISDDGRGIDVEKIRCEACDMGLVEGDIAGKMPEEDVLKLIFSDGVSTADKCSLISGRGVGLAVVKHEVELLGGKVDVSSQPGRGTTFVFHLPCEV